MKIYLDNSLLQRKKKVILNKDKLQICMSALNIKLTGNLQRKLFETWQQQNMT